MKTNFYTGQDYKKYLLSQVATVKHRCDMKIDVIENGTFIVDTDSGAFGVFDKDGNFIKSSLQYMGKNSNFIPKYCLVDDFVDSDAMDEYKKQLKLFQESCGGQLKIKSKKLLVKFISCFVPGRVRRGQVRKWLKEHL